MSKPRTQSAADAVKELIQGTKKAETAPEKTTTENLGILVSDTKTKIEEKPTETKTKGTWGGPRGGGRPAGGASQQRRLIREIMANHYTEEMTVKITDPKTGKIHTVKKPRVLIAIDTLFQIGITNKDAAALDKWINRAIGKAPQPLIGDQEEDAIRVDITESMEESLRRFYGNGK